MTVDDIRPPAYGGSRTYGGFRTIPTDAIIVARNVRHDSTSIDALAEDIARRGLLEPIGVVGQGEKYRVIYGHRRYRAVRKLGQPTIHAMVYPETMSERDILGAQIAENYHRSDLHFWELATELSRLHRSGWSHDEIASRLGIGKGSSVELTNARRNLIAPIVRYLDSRAGRRDGRFTRTLAVRLSKLSPQRQEKEWQKLLGENDGEKPRGRTRTTRPKTARAMLAVVDRIPDADAREVLSPLLTLATTEGRTAEWIRWAMGYSRSSPEPISTKR